MKKNIFILFSLFINLTLSAQWQTLQIDKETPSKNDIRSIVFDKDGNIWVGTSYGIYNLENNKWSLKTPKEGYIESLNISPDNIIRCGVWGGGVYMADLKNYKWKQDKQSSISMSANTIFTDSRGDIWIGTWDKGVIYLKSGKSKNYISENTPLGDNTVMCFAEDQDKIIWVGTLHGLSSFDGVNWKLFNTNNSGLVSKDIYALTTDIDRNIWIGTPSGLIQKKENEWVSYTTQNSILPSNVVLSLATDSNNIIWIGTNKGVVALKDNQQKLYTTQNSNLIDNCIQTIAIKDKKLYLGSPLGISVLDLSSFEF